MRRKKSVVTDRRHRPAASSDAMRTGHTRRTSKRSTRQARSPITLAPGLNRPLRTDATVRTIRRRPVGGPLGRPRARPHGLRLATPFMAAAGCLGYGVEAADQLDLSRFGAVVTRGTTRSREPARRLRGWSRRRPACSTRSASPNPGIEAVLDRFAPRWAALARAGRAQHRRGVRRGRGAPSRESRRRRGCGGTGARPRIVGPRALGEAGVTGSARDRAARPRPHGPRPTCHCSSSSAPCVRHPARRAGRGRRGRRRDHLRRRHAGARPSLGWLAADSAARPGPCPDRPSGRSRCGPSPRSARRSRSRSSGCGGVTSLDDVLALLMAGASAVQIGDCDARRSAAPDHVLLTSSRALCTGGGARHATVRWSASPDALPAAARTPR